MTVREELEQCIMELDAVELAAVGILAEGLANKEATEIVIARAAAYFDQHPGYERHAAAWRAKAAEDRDKSAKSKQPGATQNT